MTNHMPPASHDFADAKVYKIQLSNSNMPWREVLHMGTRFLFPKNHCEPGEKVRGFYFITKGRVRLSYMEESGKEKCALYMGKNCIFNEIPALGGKHLMSASFLCVEEVEAWRFDGELLSNVDFISNYPLQISNLLHSIAQKSGIFFLQSSEKTFSSSMQQLCTLLQELHENKDLFLSQSDIAALMGLHLTTVARLVRTLRDDGIVGKFTKNTFEVLDIGRLRQLAKNA